MRKTYVQREEYAYPNGGQTRKGHALFPDGKTRRVWAGIPDTYFTIPAHARYNGFYVAGNIMYATTDMCDNGVPEGTLVFFPYTYGKRDYSQLMRPWRNIDYSAIIEA